MTLATLKTVVDAALKAHGDIAIMVDHEPLTEMEVVPAMEGFPAYFNLVGK